MAQSLIFTYHKTIKMKTLIFIIITSLISVVGLSQSKKQVKANKIKASMVTSIENGKTINESKTIFDSKGNAIEKTDYNKEGTLKATHKLKYNSEGDETEDEEYDANNKLIEKTITKYNANADKIEELITDASGKTIKKHVYVYDSKGLKTERKTLDAEGKTISIKKYVYVTK